MDELKVKTAPLQTVEHPILREADVCLDVLRLDLIHPLIHGNKWFKLKHNLDHIQSSGIKRVLSFGGAWSNHLYALAAAGKQLGLHTIGVVRGETPEPLNPVLEFARQQGMHLYPISRDEYRHKTEPDFIESLHQQLGGFYLLPEGGSNELAVRGCEEIAEIISASGWKGWDGSAGVTNNSDCIGKSNGRNCIALACGTGTTMAGVVSGLGRMEDEVACAEVLGFSILKGEGYLRSEVANQLEAAAVVSPVQWQMLEEYHCGGYAKINSSLKQFLESFPDYSDIPLEPVYTGKLFYGIFDMLNRSCFPAGSHILAIHTGGIVEKLQA